MDEEQVVARPDDSHATMPYYSPRESRSHGSTSVGDASSAAPDELRADVAREATWEIDARAVVQAATARASVVVVPAEPIPVVQPTVVYVPVV
jgi:hypothetical protein